MREGSVEMSYRSEMPLRDEADKEKVLEILETKVNKIFDFLNNNQQLIQETFTESEVLRSSGIEPDLDYVRENIKKLIPQLEKHKSAIRIIFNHLEDRVGLFLGGPCGIMQRIINGRPFSAELIGGLKKDSAAFARYLKDILENENYLDKDIGSYQGQSLH